MRKCLLSFCLHESFTDTNKGVNKTCKCTTVYEPEQYQEITKFKTYIHFSESITKKNKNN